MNNNNLIVSIGPFLFKQNILIYQDGVCVKQDNVSMGQVHDKISQYCKLYDISIVNLCGNKSFVNKFAKNLNTKFDLDKEIHIFIHNNIYFKDEEDNNE